MSSIYKVWRNCIQSTPWPPGAIKIPKIQAHRGYHLEGIRENTLKSLEAAAQRGAEMCEFDVQLTSDQIPVLFHDFDLIKVTGEKKQISSMSLEELRRRCEITTLREALEANSIAKIGLNIELKTIDLDGRLSQKVAEVVVAARAQNRLLFSSFNSLALLFVEKVLPDIPRAFLVTAYSSAQKFFYFREMSLSPLLKLHMLNIDQNILTNEEIGYWQKKQMPLSVWTVNEEVRINHFLSRGVQSVISDSIMSL